MNFKKSIQTTNETIAFLEDQGALLNGKPALSIAI